MAKKEEFTLKQLQNLGNRFKQLRKEKGYTNYEIFAFDNEIPRAQYGRYENGEDLRFSSLLKVLKALDISLDEFFSEGFDV
jgi:transcriptional regulator with XRE-family HTH domain